MSNLKAKEIKKNFNGTDYILRFDMNSLDTFQESNSKGLMLSLKELLMCDDKTTLAFIESSIRKADDPDTVLGKKIYEEVDLLDLMFGCAKDVNDLILASLPENKKKVI